MIKKRVREQKYVKLGRLILLVWQPLFLPLLYELHVPSFNQLDLLLVYSSVVTPLCFAPGFIMKQYCPVSQHWAHLADNTTFHFSQGRLNQVLLFHYDYSV